MGSPKKKKVNSESIPIFSSNPSLKIKPREVMMIRVTVANI